jgi:hypothetical protein
MEIHPQKVQRHYEANVNTQKENQDHQRPSKQ